MTTSPRTSDIARYTFIERITRKKQEVPLEEQLRAAARLHQGEIEFEESKRGLFKETATYTASIPMRNVFPFMKDVDMFIGKAKRVKN